MTLNNEINNWTKIEKAFSIEDSQIFKTKSFKIDYIQEKGLTSTQLKKLRNEWIKILPQLDNVEFAYFGGKITQEYFESICSMRNLRGLWIKWTQLDDFSIIRKLESLNYLKIGGSIKISNLHGLEYLNNLKSIELNGFFGIKNLIELKDLTNIERLELYGSFDGKRLHIENIDALSNLRNIKVLALDVKRKAVDINPIFCLDKLEKLIIPKSYFKDMTKTEIARLFPNLKNGLIEY